MTFRSVFVLGAISVLSMVTSSNAATAATTADVAATALPSLVDSLPSCATKCFATVGGEIDCNTTDLKCMCGQDDVFQAHWGTCLRKECNDKELNQGLDTRDNICAAMSKNPDSAAVESASSVIEANTPEETDSGASGLMPATAIGVIGAIVFGTMMI